MALNKRNILGMKCTYINKEKMNNKWNSIFLYNKKLLHQYFRSNINIFKQQNGLSFAYQWTYKENTKIKNKRYCNAKNTFQNIHLFC